MSTMHPVSERSSVAHSVCNSPQSHGMVISSTSMEQLFREVPDLSNTTKIIGTRAFAHGGYSDIWRGISWDIEDSTQQVAIKIIRVATWQQVSIERIKKRISREVITWRSAQHKNIVPFYGLCWLPGGRDDALPSMVYPYCAAGTCTDYLGNNPNADRLEIIHQVAEGLIYLHTRMTPQVVHGDIRSSNVLMRNDGVPMLADFGLSRMVAEVSTGLTTSSSRGSYRWMAPELFGGVDSQVIVPVTVASDVWAFGCLCIEILTDALPWASIKNVGGIMRAIVLDRLQPPLPSVPESNTIGHILRHCWMWDPTDRPEISDLSLALRLNDPSMIHKPICTLNHSPLVLSEPPPPVLGNDTDLPTDQLDSISSTMSIPEIVDLLIKHKCPDVTLNLDLEQCGSHAISGGGFSDIYAGTLCGGRKVAIKCARFYLQDKEGRDVVKETARELYIWSSLKHPNVLELVGLAKFRDQISMVSPWMENGTLPEYIAQNPEVDRYQLCYHISLGLAYLHDTDTVHGDVKGLNVVISEDGIPKITDFGTTVLSNYVLHFTGASSACDISLRWAAPELLNEGCVYTKAADVYALGMTFLEVVTGEIPFSGKGDPSVLVIVAGLKKTPERPRVASNVLKESLVDGLWQIMLQCWAFNPTSRPSLQEIKEQLFGISLLEQPASTSPQKQKPLEMLRDSSQAMGEVDQAQGSTLGEGIIRTTLELPLPLMDCPPSIVTQRQLSRAEINDLTVISSGMMSTLDIIVLLVEPGCPDMTDQLDLERCGNHPVSGGGFGDLYRGSLVRGTEVAIKCARLFVKKNKSGRDVLKVAARELHTWSSLKHPNVLELVGLARFRDRVSMISPWMKNGTLPEYIAQNPVVDRYQLCRQISEGLLYLHDTGIVHGDVKGRNVLISEDGIAKLTEFGNTDITKYTLKSTGTTRGSSFSFRWMAPESLDGKCTHSKAADVYALGMTFIEIVTGQVPFSDRPEQAVFFDVVTLRKIPERPSAELDLLGDELTQVLWGVMEGCWAYDPIDRPDSRKVSREASESPNSQSSISPKQQLM